MPSSHLLQWGATRPGSCSVRCSVHVREAALQLVGGLMMRSLVR